MTVKRTTIELDEELVRKAQSVTGSTLRSTVESALRRLIAEAQGEADERRRRITEHLASAGKQVDTDALLSDQAWR
ncbi:MULTISPECIES: type II toxin-antitoxin system VapB family antitoxin [Mycolicibacter]|uniref:Antitoxin n=1 Tax=Mycolicibacter senuensis TaxID=386913 RepID=A0A7I9XPD9_9MYCO|nr:type II toxin-antitoxin system VapB family antitoxin [Mycolicibacter senuensis]MDQ2627459.1 type II toxin-antitoxin system VapB family antitoxin [Actinomycetota bacterium]GFG71227.1 antitoxin [Mycolicibacter senuensis]